MHWNAKVISGSLDSPAGAKGVAQFMPATWKTWGNGGDIYNPADAISAQARLMCALYKRYDGNLDKMLSGYNAGTGAVDRYDGVPPYSETIGYIKAIRKTYSDWG